MINDIKSGGNVKTDEGSNVTDVGCFNNVVENLAQCRLGRVTLADCRMFQLDDEQICGFSLMTANRSSSFDSVDSLLTGRKFFITDVSRFAFAVEGWRQHSSSILETIRWKKKHLPDGR